MTHSTHANDRLESTDSNRRDDRGVSTDDPRDDRDEPTAVVLVSGGMDSATAIAEATERGFDPLALHVSYGQRTAEKELACAETLADHYDARAFLHVEADHFAAIGGSTLVDGEESVPDADLDADEVPSTYVPFRNANLLAMAVSWAEVQGASVVFVGAHSEDYSGYPDCRPAFFDAFQAVVDAGTKPETDVAVVAPFVEWSKAEIARRGLELGVPYEHTWSCYRADAPACGTCDACAYRLAAFQSLDARDPIEYERRPSYA